MSEQDEVNAAIKRFTPRARQSLTLAQREAERSNHDCIAVEHLMCGICLLNEGIAIEVLRAMKVNFQHLLAELARKMPQPGPETRQIGALPFSASLRKIIIMSGSEARAMRCNYIGTEHLLLAILNDGATASAALRSCSSALPSSSRYCACDCSRSASLCFSSRRSSLTCARSFRFASITARVSRMADSSL